MSDHHARLRQSLIGIRTALSMLIYTPENAGWLTKVDTNHHAGGVMDHLASLIDSLDPEPQADEPGDREPFFPAPHDPVQGVTLTPAQVADGWHYCPAFDGLLTRGENPSGTHCFCGHPNTSTGDTQ